jgi:hypothetical protein
VSERFFICRAAYSLYLFKGWLFFSFLHLDMWKLCLAGKKYLCYRRRYIQMKNYCCVDLQKRGKLKKKTDKNICKFFRLWYLTVNGPLRWERRDERVSLCVCTRRIKPSSIDRLKINSAIKTVHKNGVIQMSFPFPMFYYAARCALELWESLHLGRFRMKKSLPIVQFWVRYIRPKIQWPKRQKPQQV